MDSLILDTDFLYGLFVEIDPHHKNCLKIAEAISQYNLFISNLVVYELITLLSRRIGQKESLDVLSQIQTQGFNLLVVKDDTHTEVLNTFKKFNNKNISAVDCANLVLAKKYSFKILSFDKFYPAELLLQ
jgi:predicted nucleic acid-binding protein